MDVNGKHVIFSQNLITKNNTKYCILKEYYESVNEARPLSGFFPTAADLRADLFTEMHF